MKSNRPAIIIWLLTPVLLSACAKKVPAQVPATPAIPATTEVGLASWYGEPYHGQPAASGEIYDMNALTAAHRTLPFGTMIRVENLENHTSVDLRINDRGPFVEDRIVDVSAAAARVLGFMGAGIARVRLEVLAGQPETREGCYAVQVGAFRDRTRAERLQAGMETRYGSAVIVERAGDPVLWRVLVGKAVTVEEANALSRRIRAENPETAGAAFVVRLD